MPHASPGSLGSLDLATLAAAYASGSLTPITLVDAIYARLAEQPHAGVFISEVEHARARQAAQNVVQRRAAGEALPLFGVPFAVKDNIDALGLETTAACPAFAYRPDASAPAVQRLLDAGAILIGKTNLDQFATGLVGVRSPYGVPENAFSAAHVPGGSSSGSGVAVARGFVSFALGTDTAGSGRVPAGFNNIVGLKPTRGMLSGHGVVPACRSLDCVSIFALTVDDAANVARLMTGFDERDPYSRPEAASWDPRPGLTPPRFRFALPAAPSLALEPAATEPFAAAVSALEALGGSSTPLSLEAFDQTAALLYHGPMVAERLEAAGELLARDPDALHPVIREILNGARRYDALAALRGYAELSHLRRTCYALLHSADFLLVPTASLHPRVAEVLADPLSINTELGRYTNFVNLLDLCALAVPAGMRADGLPFGVTLIAPPGRDALLASVGRALHAALSRTLGATGVALPAYPNAALAEPVAAGRARIAVVGAHLSGEPLNGELTDRGARLVRSARTAPRYQLFALPTAPAKPGLVRATHGGEGHAIELEIWELDDAGFGEFVKRIPGPLGIGAIELEVGPPVQGFLCERAAIDGAPEISSFGGWRAYRRSRG